MAEDGDDSDDEDGGVDGGDGDGAAAASAAKLSPLPERALVAAGLAEGLAARHRVLEPWQRGSGDEALTVARHVEDLDCLVAALPQRPGCRAARCSIILKMAKP